MTTSQSVGHVGTDVHVPDYVLEKWRDVNVDGLDWWDSVYEMWQEKLLTEYDFTIDPKGFAFSGFWSQGDGASFTGEVNDSLKFLEKYPDKFGALKLLVEKGGDLHISMQRLPGSHYVHHNTVYASISCDSFFSVHGYTRNADAQSDTHLAVSDALDQRRTEETDELEELVKDIFQGLMQEMYRDLEREYDYLTSDEVVRETIIANDLHTEE